MSCRVDTAPLLAGACVVSLYAGHGVRGDAVPSTGTHGPSPVYNDLSLPADAANEYRWAVVSPPSVGTLVVYEDCSYTYTPPGGTVDLTVSYTYRLWQGGADVGTATQTIVIGAGSSGVYALQSSPLVCAAQLAAVAMSYTPPAATTYSLQASALTGAGQLASESMSYTAPGGIVSPPRRRVHLSFPPPRIGGLRSLGGD